MDNGAAAEDICYILPPKNKQKVFCRQRILKNVENI